MRRCSNPKCLRVIGDHEDCYRDHAKRTFCTDCIKKWGLAR